MEWAIILLTLLVIGLAAALAVVLMKGRDASRQEQDRVDRVSGDLQAQMGALRDAMKDQSLELSRQIQDHMKNSTSFLQETHRNYSQTVGHLQHRLGELQEATQSMMEIGRDISSLQDILRSPKLRGGLGELMLAELLRQILPEDHFSLQFGFDNGTKVDAVIRLGEGLIPIDAKFPLENFRRILDASSEEASLPVRKQFYADVKKHIDSIASKYILPAEGTFDFALMYIPAENVYYETIIKDEFQQESLVNYAMKKRVIPVSPCSFYAYLQAIVRGLKGLRIESSAKMILESLGQLEADFLRCYGDFEKVGSHLNNARSAYDKTEKRFERIHNKLQSIEAHEERELLADD